MLSPLPLSPDRRAAGVDSAPTCFSHITQKPRRAAPLNLLHLRTDQKYILSATFDMLSEKVRSPGDRSGLSRDVHPGTVFKLQDRAVGTVLV